MDRLQTNVEVRTIERSSAAGLAQRKSGSFMATEAGRPAARPRLRSFGRSFPSPTTKSCSLLAGRALSKSITRTSRGVPNPWTWNGRRTAYRESCSSFKHVRRPSTPPNLAPPRPKFIACVKHRAGRWFAGRPWAKKSAPVSHMSFTRRASWQRTCWRGTVAGRRIRIGSPSCARRRDRDRSGWPYGTRGDRLARVWLPCIVGAGNATSVLQTGQDVTVSCCEGAEGHVYAGRVPFDVDRIDASKVASHQNGNHVDRGRSGSGIRAFASSEFRCRSGADGIHHQQPYRNSSDGVWLTTRSLKDRGSDPKNCRAHRRRRSDGILCPPLQ